MLWRLYIPIKYIIKLPTKFNNFLKSHNKIRNLSNTGKLSSAVNFHRLLAEIYIYTHR